MSSYIHILCHRIQTVFVEDPVGYLVDSPDLVCGQLVDIVSKKINYYY